MSLWFPYQIRVRYAETDQMGVVYHTHYLNWMEVARTEYIRILGKPYKEIENRGMLLPVIDLEVKFRAPARYDDLVVIYTRLKEFSHLRLGFEYEIRRKQGSCESEAGDRPSDDSLIPGSGFVSEPEGELLVSGGTRHVWANRDFKPQRLDKNTPDVYELIANHIQQCEA